MKAGVSTSPCGVRIRPTRAPPSVLKSSKPNPLMKSDDEHGVAVRIEPIARRDGVTIGVEQELPAAKGGDEQEERRAREMEVRDQPVDDLEPIARIDVDVGGATARPHPAACVRRPLERPGRRGPDG